MKWKKNKSSVTLEPQDMQIMAQCKMPVNEMLRSEHPNKRIPPLWSVLSYVMLQYRCEPNGLWYRYRLLNRIAKNASRCYYHRYIPKSNGGVREIYIPSYMIQRQQGFILSTILKELPIDDHAFAYRKGKRIKDCAEPHKGKSLLIHLDLKNFFGSITEDMVFMTLYRETGYAKSLCRFLAQLCCLHGSLPQGTVTSPILSNIVFRSCDKDLATVAQKHGMDYTRYSDDLYFSGADMNVNPFLEEVTGILLFYGFKINTEKTQIRRRQHRQSVLGLTVNEKIQTTREYRRSLLQEVYYLERFGKNCKGAIECGNYLKYMQQLQGKLSYILHIDPTNVKFQEANEKLIRRMNQHSFLLERGFIT